jgi:hypothetical protein
MRSTTDSRSRLGASLRDPLVWRHTLALGLPVGLLQAALNQGDHWLHHAVDRAVLLKTLLSPLLSCTIAFLSAAATRRRDTSEPTTS